MALFVDNAHFLDANSCTFILRLRRACPALRLVVTHRPLADKRSAFDAILHKMGADAETTRELPKPGSSHDLLKRTPEAKTRVLPEEGSPGRPKIAPAPLLRLELRPLTKLEMRKLVGSGVDPGGAPRPMRRCR